MRLYGIPYKAQKLSENHKKYVYTRNLFSWYSIYSGAGSNEDRMSTHECILIGLDLSEMDQQLMKAARLLAPVLQTEKMYLLHVMPDFTVPKEAVMDFHQRFAPDQPVDEKVKIELEKTASDVFGTVIDDIVVDVREGKPYQKVLHWMEVKNASFLIVGHKASSRGSGITARRVSRNVAADVLFVPEKKRKTIERIVVPIDFSENSARAVQSALHWKRHHPGTVVDTVYFIDMPPSDYYVGAARDAGLRAVLKESAKDAYKRYLTEFELDERELQMHFIDNAYSNVSLHVDEFAREKGADLIVIGAQGHSAFERFLFGSVTEKLVDENREQLIWVVR